MHSKIIIALVALTQGFAFGAPTARDVTCPAAGSTTCKPPPVSAPNAPAAPLPADCSAAESKIPASVPFDVAGTKASVNLQSGTCSIVVSFTRSTAGTAESIANSDIQSAVSAAVSAMNSKCQSGTGSYSTCIPTSVGSQTILGVVTIGAVTV